MRYSIEYGIPHDPFTDIFAVFRFQSAAPPRFRFRGYRTVAERSVADSKPYSTLFI